MSKGWISVHRSILDHPIWQGEKFTKGHAWLDLILNANHKQNKVMIKGRLITVERGEQIRSQVTLAKTWKWNPRTVSRFLEMLKSDGMITTKSTELTTHITICNYSTFQDAARKSAELTTQQSAEGVQSRVQTNNNVNNDNKKPINGNTPFKPPTLEEVSLYVNEKGYCFDAEVFHAHYETSNWFRGKTKIKNWKSCCTTWQKNNKPKQEKPKYEGNVI